MADYHKAGKSVHVAENQLKATMIELNETTSGNTVTGDEVDDLAAVKVAS